MDLQKLIFFLFIFFSLNFYGQKDSIKTINLPSVTIKSSRITERELKIPLSVTSQSFEDSQEIRQQLSLNDYINNIPGLFALNSANFSQDLRISIRGFGARSAFGIRGIKILVDGIPETTPDGQGQIDNLNLGIIKNIEVMKGPAASLYGNASGGVISIYTLDNFDKSYINAGISFGSYQFQQFQSSVGFSSGKNSFIIQGTKTNTDGYRVQSGFKNDNINLRMRHLFSDNTSLNVHINYTDSPYAGDAGGLTLEEVKDNRRQARSRNLEFKTKESIDQFKTGASFNHRWNQSSVDTYGFYSSRNFYGLLPFEFGGIVDLGRNYYGFGSTYTIKSNKGKSENSFQVGYDLAHQEDERQRFKNLQGDQGDQTLDQIESFGSFGVFALNHFSTGKFLFRTGMRYDRTKLEVADQFLTNGNQSDANTLTAFNPSIGIGYQLLKNQHLYANFSTSFETPVLSELSSNPTGEGGFNELLKAQKAKNFEIGYKLKSQFGQAELALFHIETSNDIVPFEIEEFPGRTFYKNAGSTHRQGVEISYSLKLIENLRVSTGYTYSKFYYADYKTPSGNFEDKQLPGIPKHMGAISFNYQNKKGLKILLNNQYVGNLFVDDANTVSDKSYLNTSLNVGFSVPTKELRFTPFLGVNNLFNTSYNDNIRINAFGGRYYEPAPGISLFAGIRASHNLN
jgi:iron complex outermembrane receptor protein